jgi:hypothetical protein
MIEKFKVKHVELKADIDTVLQQIGEDDDNLEHKARRLCVITGMNDSETNCVLAEIFSPPHLNLVLDNAKAGTWLRAGGFFDLVRDVHTGEYWDFLSPTTVEDVGDGYEMLTLGW